MVKVISWNIAHRDEGWRHLLDTDADVALLSEAAAPPPDVASQVEVDPAPWHTAGAGVNRPWRTVVVKLSRRVEVQWLEPKSIADAAPTDLAVSRPGTLAAAIVAGGVTEPFVVAAMYAAWERPHTMTGSGWIYADGSVHRLISDLSALIGVPASIGRFSPRFARLERRVAASLGPGGGPSQALEGEQRAHQCLLWTL